MDTDSYQIRMLAGNAIPSLLKSRIQAVNGHYTIYYDITSRQQMSSFYEDKKIELSDLEMILESFVRITEEMSEYLMNTGNLLIQPEYIYLDIENKKMYFCYFPGKHRDIREQLQTLMEYILPKLQHNDERAVILGYGIYRKVLEDNFQLENIKNELYHIKADEEVEKKVFSEISSEALSEPVRKDSLDINEEEFYISGEKNASETNAISTWKTIAGFGIVTGILLGVVFLKIWGFIPWFETTTILGICIGAGIIMMAGWWIYRHFKSKMQISEAKERQWETEADEPMEFPEVVETEIKAEEKKEREEKIPSSYGETVILSVNTEAGPASFVSREPGELATIYLQKDITVIGKLQEAVDAVIDLPTVSRIQAKVRKKGEEYIISDLNSRNGTSINGKLLKSGEEHILQNQDEVDFAQARYVFVNF